MSEIKEIICESVKEWREWLEKNHLKEDRVLLIRYKKHTGKGSFNQREAMDEAICFGWIDTTMKRVDDEKYGVKFVKRGKSSKWSENTFARAREMISKGKMSDFGMKMFNEGLLKPTHDSGIPKNPDMPEDLKKELNKNGNRLVKINFDNMGKSYKRAYFRWILSAKRDETRNKRIREVVERVRIGKKLGD